MIKGLKAVGLVCKERRKERGWTQTVAAEKAGTSRPVVSAIENGRYTGALWAFTNYLAALGLVISVANFERPTWDELDEVYRDED